METTTRYYDMNLKVLSFECEKGVEPYLGHIFKGEYDVPVNLPKPRILDIGANLGAFSIWASHRWPGCQIYAYEPNDQIFDILQRNIAVNTSGNVVLIKEAIGNPGPRMFYQGNHNCGEAGLYTKSNKPGYELMVSCPTSLPEANVLKMDTEGCEVEILEPLLKQGRKFDVIMYEYHRENDMVTLANLLEKDYNLVKAEIHAPGRGTMCYMSNDIMELRRN